MKLAEIDDDGRMDIATGGLVMVFIGAVFSGLQVGNLKRISSPTNLESVDS